MWDIKHKWKSFYVNDELEAQYPELIKLVLHTESMDDEERQYWFDLLPTMNPQQINRLFEILDTERKKLQELENKYQEEIKLLNEKHLIEWQDYQVKQSKKKLEEEEAKDKKQWKDDEDPEDVLKLLDSF